MGTEHSTFLTNNGGHLQNAATADRGSKILQWEGY